MRIYAHMAGNLIDNVIVVDPSNCGDFKLDEYIDITDIEPRPGIDWIRNSHGWEPPRDIPIIIEAPPIVPASLQPQVSAMQNEEEHDTVIPEQEEQVNGLTTDN